MVEHVVFLSVADVKGFHRDQIDRYGGSHGIRDEGLIQSAVAQPFAAFGGQFLHPTIFLMAAAYLFFLARNHGFVDGTKRTAVIAARVFLSLNNIKLLADPDELYNCVQAVVEGSLSKEDVADFLELNSRPVAEAGSQ